jgi:outer membrane protein assembly factor BamB
VFIAATGEQNATLWALDAATGAQLSKTLFGAQQERYYAPTIEGGAVYSACASALGMCAFNHADGARNWFTRLALYEEWTPAVDANYAYSYLGGVLSALVKSTGQVAFTITDPGFERDGFGTHGAPVLGTNGAVIAVSGGNAFGDNRLVSFNTATRGLYWSVPGRYGGAPVLAKGVVYVTHVSVESSRPTLEARRESTGELLWSWTPTRLDEKAREGLHGRYSDLLVTDNLIFISTNERVYAIDLATHAPVWSYWKTGNLAMSANGVLYINNGGSIGAVNLK